jgi:CrcB protein
VRHALRTAISERVLNALYVGLGGFIGAILRYGIGQWIARAEARAFPLATLGVNVLGSFLIGLLMSLFLERQSFSEEMRLLLVTGLLGSLTTFSTFSWETVELFRQGQLGGALGNVLWNLGLSIAAVVLGILAARSFSGA